MGATPGWDRKPRKARAPLEVHEALFTFPDGPQVKLVACTRDALIRTGARMDAHLGNLRPASPTEGNDNHELRDAVENAIGALLAILQGHDAFEVMVRVRDQVLPLDLGQWEESESSLLNSWAVGEVVALALIGLGLPSRDPRCQVATASIIDELVVTAGSLVQLASYASLTRWSERDLAEGEASGVGKLAAVLSTHETIVRGRQYESIATIINDSVLRTPQTEKAFRSALGFTFDDVMAVRNALIDGISADLDDLFDRVAVHMQTGQPLSQVDQAAAQALFETRSLLHPVTSVEVAGRSGLDASIVEKVLDQFAIAPDGRPPEELIWAFVDGRNQMAGKAILHAPSRGYLPLPGAIAPDEIRRTCEGTIKGRREWTPYGRARDKAAEDLAIGTLDSLLDGQAQVHKNLRYRGPAVGVDLGANALGHSMAPVVEADGLLLVDGVALCVEVKAGDLRAKTRQGGAAQLDGDLDKTIKAADSQANRLRELIAEHGGLWLEDGSWLDLTSVLEIHTIVVCLDDLGPLSVGMAGMVEAGVLASVQLPWVVTAHDLIVADKVFDRPEHFLTYLRRRCNRDAALWVVGTDELDVIMWFAAGGFYFVPDPDRIQARYPFMPRPSTKDRREYAEQGRTLVGTFTDPLDAYFYWTEGTSSEPAECPHRAPMPSILQSLVDDLRAAHAPGWLRMASDLDGFSATAQKDLAKRIDQLVAMTTRDAGFHTCAIGGGDDTGRWVMILATGPNSEPTRQHLELYLRAKKHSERADRAFGVLLDQGGKTVASTWLAHEHSEDPELDALVGQMRLQPPGVSTVRPPTPRKPKARTRKKRR